MHNIANRIVKRFNIKFFKRRFIFNLFCTKKQLPDFYIKISYLDHFHYKKNSLFIIFKDLKLNMFKCIPSKIDMYDEKSHINNNILFIYFFKYLFNCKKEIHMKHYIIKRK